MSVKRKVLAGSLAAAVIFGGLSSNIFANSSTKQSDDIKTTSVSSAVDVNEHEAIEYVKGKMDQYRESYAAYNGTDEGFDESSVLEIAPELYEMSKAGGTSAQSRAVLSKYFDSIKWITRSGVVSLSIMPSQQFKNLPTDNSRYGAAIEESWGIILRNYSGNSKWKNTASMKGQYRCHAWYAKSKYPWNIEPHRTETDFNKIVAKLCNP